MWAGNNGMWPQAQWPLQQSVYQNIPHEQVDWAALAQQWIQMKESRSDGEPPSASQNANVLPPRPDRQPQIATLPLLPRPPEGSAQILERSLPAASARFGLEPNEIGSENGSSFENSESNWDNGNPSYWQSSWNAAPPNWVPPQPQDNRESSFEYERKHGNQGYGVQNYNYNHGSDQLYVNKMGEQSSYNQYWTQSGSVNPPFLRGNQKDRPNREETSMITEDPAGVPFNLDAVKCKNLPAWIREGLEKMDRDKQKKLDRERMLQEREERLKQQQEEEALREAEAAKDDSVYTLRKSKFESDSEDDDSSDVRTRSPSQRRSMSPFQRRTPSPIISQKSEQEKLEEMMVKVRRMLTEVLLEVTNEEISFIAKEYLNKELNKAPAQQLTKSSALASITGSLGLGHYESDSEASENERGKEEAEYESEENMQRRRTDFHEREKQIAAAFKNELADDDDTDSDEKKGKGPTRGEIELTYSMFPEHRGPKHSSEVPGFGDSKDEPRRKASIVATSLLNAGNKSSNSEINYEDSPSDSESNNGSKKSKGVLKVSKSKSSSRSQSKSPARQRRNSRRESNEDDSKNSRKRSRSEYDGSKSSRNKDKRRRSRSSSRERKYRKSPRRSKDREREKSRKHSNYRRRSRTRSRSRDRPRYHRRDSRKRSRSRSTSSKSDRSRSRERRNSRRSYSRSPPSKKDNNWEGTSRAGKK